MTKILLQKELGLGAKRRQIMRKAEMLEVRVTIQVEGAAWDYVRYIAGRH